MSIAHKGLVVVALPLIFELAFVGSLAYILQCSENELEQQQRAKAAVAASASLDKLFEQASMEVANYALTKSPVSRSHFGQLCEETGRQASELRNIYSLVHLQQDDIQNLTSITGQGLRLLKQAAAALSGGDKSAAELGLMAKKLRRIGMDIDQVGYAALGKDRPSELLTYLKIKETVGQFLIGGLALNTAAAIALALFFSRGITTRLRVVWRNSLKLAIQQPLEPPIGGSDEISELDEMFHKMATTLAEAREKETALSENALDILCAFDAKGRFSQINRAVIDVLGYRPDELLGSTILSLVSETQVAGMLSTIRKLIEQSPTISLEVSMRRKDGLFCDTFWSMYWSKQQGAIYCVIHDISERKRLERMKMDVVSMISHDLRSPLTTLSTIMENFSYGMYGNLSEEAGRKIHKAETVVSRLILMINDLLDVEKLQAGMFQLDLANERVSDLLTRAIDAVHGVAESKNIQLFVQKAMDSETRQPESRQKDLGTMLCDGEKMVRVLVNLMDNAIKFSPVNGRVDIVVTDFIDMIEVSVRDEGRGIPAEKRTQIFERFRQIEKSDETEKKGSGLGLAICKAIVESHHGFIDVESQQGHGSRFFFRIPKAKVL